MNVKEKIILLFYSISFPYKATRFIYENIDTEILISNFSEVEKVLKENIGESACLKLKNAISWRNIENCIQKLQNYGVSPVFCHNDEYPNCLKQIASPPIVLFCKGNVNILKSKCIAIVGTRRPTMYGREVTKLFSSALSKAGLVTVSGLAYGLDMEVALSTLDVKGKTIAVLGGGLNKIYPEQNTNLAQRILENDGLLISLMWPTLSPTKYSFLDRNRIISGLSLGTLIVEAGESSGTLNTANHTIDQGRELFVVPANILSAASLGSNKLIEEMPDTYTISPEHILKRLHINFESQKLDKKASLGEMEKQIVNALYEQDLDIDMLKEKTNLDSKSLISLLTRMEINGLIKKLPGNIYSL